MSETISATELHHSMGHYFAQELSMNIYPQPTTRPRQVEVYSVPVGRTAQVVQDHRIYACPQSYNPPECGYLAPRIARGGEIPVLYRVIAMHDVATKTLNEQLAAIDRVNHPDNQRAVSRIRAFFEDPRGKTDVGDEDLVVFVLHLTAFELPHRPRPKRNNPFRTGRWTLADLLDPLSIELPTS
ncbi:hypothetical protein CYJ73_26155 [Gordonia terrae]|uniref:Uncharacterized protein n=2 Tax=Gordonia terrae TaxID=2055 RepID=A0A2I1R0H4_9ACTN|nr:hypothetical protein CYJ73_26155 [Gordonia terrae]